jgi:hypothetical protein
MAATGDPIQRLSRLHRKLWEAKVWLRGLGFAVIAFGLLYWAAGIQVPDVQVPVTPVALAVAGVVMLGLGRLAGSYESEAAAVADSLSGGVPMRLTDAEPHYGPSDSNKNESPDPALSKNEV